MAQNLPGGPYSTYLTRGRRLINITVSKYHCINPIWYKFLIFWIVSKNFRWYKKYCFCLTKYFLIQKYLYQKNLRKIWWYKKYLYQKYFLWRILIQIFLRMDDTNFSNFVSPTFRVIQMIQISFLVLGSSTIWVYRGGRHAAPVSRLIFPSPSPKPVPTLGQTLAPHPKRSHKSTWTNVSWSSKALSDKKEKLLWLVIVMIEKWFYQHFLSFFQAYSLIHREPTLTFTVD